MSIWPPNIIFLKSLRELNLLGRINRRAGSFRYTAFLSASVLGLIGGVGVSIPTATPTAANAFLLYAASSAVGSGSCADIADACTLTTALGVIPAGGTIELVTPGSVADYVGQFSVNLSGTSSTEPITIEPATGVTNPTINGNNGGLTFSVVSGVYVTLIGLTITGGNNTASTAAGGGVNNAGNLTLTNTTVTGNSAVSGGTDTLGGGIYNSGTMTINTSTISSNSALTGSGTSLQGGGIYNANGATMSIDRSTISANSATSASEPSEGGGIDNYGTLTITNSTINGNTAASGGVYLSQGGGLNNAGTLKISNSTVTGNTSSSSSSYARGGGLFNNGTTMVVTSATVVGNTVSGSIDQGSGIFTTGGTVDLAGDLFAGQSSTPAGGECATIGGLAVFTDLGYNVSDDASCGFLSNSGSVSSASSAENLGSFANNGGPTFSIEPLSGNAAVGVIPQSTTVTANGANVTLCPTTDQRGTASASGAPCSSGSVQFAAQSISFNPPANGALGGGVTLTATGGPSASPVVFSIDPGTVSNVCQSTGTNGQDISFTGSGSCIVDANQTGSQNTFAAATVVKTIQVSQTPPAPPVLQSPSVVTNSTTLTWTPSSSTSYSPATGYQVFEGTAPSSESTTPITCSSQTATSCTVTGLNPTTTYYFYVKATNASGNSMASNEVSASTVNPTSNIGYYIAANDGGVFAYGSATFYGSLSNTALNKPIVGMTSTPDGKGYWLVASDGGVFSFGDATFYGSTGNMTLNKPIVGITSTPDGKGYWLVASDGGVFSYGDATFYGSTGNMTLNKPIVGISSSADGKGYWLVASDGGVFSFGDATFEGAPSSLSLSQSANSIASIHLVV